MRFSATEHGGDTLHIGAREYREPHERQRRDPTGPARPLAVAPLGPEPLYDDGVKASYSF